VEQLLMMLSVVLTMDMDENYRDFVVVVVDYRVQLLKIDLVLLWIIEKIFHHYLLN
jgi:hypothetical protein